MVSNSIRMGIEETFKLDQKIFECNFQFKLSLFCSNARINVSSDMMMRKTMIGRL